MANKPSKQPKGTTVSNQESTKPAADAPESQQQGQGTDQQQPTNEGAANGETQQGTEQGEQAPAQEGAAASESTGDTTKPEGDAPAAAQSESAAPAADTTILDSIGDAGAAPAPAPVNDNAAAEALLRPRTELEKLIDESQAQGDSILQQIVEVSAAYREAMAPNRILDDETIRSHQLALFRIIRDSLRSAGYYKQALDILLGYIREDQESNGALSVPFMMRGFDSQALANMSSDNRKLFWSFVTLLTTAAGMNDPKQTYTKVSLKQFEANPSLTQEMRNRMVSYFSS